jgi:hypothetical protein
MRIATGTTGLNCAAALRIAPRDIQVPLAPSGSRRVIPFAATVLRSLALLRYRSRASSHNDLTPFRAIAGFSPRSSTFHGSSAGFSPRSSTFHGSSSDDTAPRLVRQCCSGNRSTRPGHAQAMMTNRSTTAGPPQHGSPLPLPVRLSLGGSDRNRDFKRPFLPKGRVLLGS